LVASASSVDVAARPIATPFVGPWHRLAGQRWPSARTEAPVLSVCDPSHMFRSDTGLENEDRRHPAGSNPNRSAKKASSASSARTTLEAFRKP